MENPTNKSEGTKPTHNRTDACAADWCAGEWIKERQAAHLAAWQEARRKSAPDLAADLEALADDCADRAGDLTEHDDAFPDLMQEATARHAAEVLRNVDDLIGQWTADGIEWDADSMPDFLEGLTRLLYVSQDRKEGGSK